MSGAVGRKYVRASVHDCSATHGGNRTTRALPSWRRWPPYVETTVMPRTWPNPWPQTAAEVRKWQINNGYDFLLERLELPETLFAANAYSLDGIALTMIAFSTLAEYYGRFIEAAAVAGQPPLSTRGKDVRRFRLLLDTFAPSFTNRISIPTLAREIRDATDSKMVSLIPMLAPMLRQFPIALVPQVRHDVDDPTRAAFEAWAANKHFTLPNALFNRADYAGLLLANYRHSVVHELSIAKAVNRSTSETNSAIHQPWRFTAIIAIRGRRTTTTTYDSAFVRSAFWRSQRRQLRTRVPGRTRPTATSSSG
jgi:hypothetical protein